MFIPISDDVNTWRKDDKLLFIEDYFWINQDKDCLEKYTFEIFDVDYCNLGVSPNDLLDFMKEISEYMGEILNEYHGKSYSILYWKRVLWPWLMKFVPLVALRYARLCKVIEKYHNCTLSCNILNQDEWDYVPLDPIDIERMDDCKYGMHIYSAIISHSRLPIEVAVLTGGRKYCIPKIDYTEVFKKNITNNRTVNGIFTKIKNGIRSNYKSPIKYLKKIYYRLWNLLIYKENPDDIELVMAWFGSKDLAIKLRYLTNGRVAWFPYVGIEPRSHKVVNYPDVDEEFRQTAADKLSKAMQVDIEWKKIIVKMLFQEIPICYVENYDKCAGVYRGIFEKYKNLKFILSDYAAFYPESLFSFAEQREKGVRFSAMMHGACIPSKYCIGLHGAMCDVFYGWGEWGNDVPKEMMEYRQSPAIKLYWYDGMNVSTKDYVVYIGDVLQINLQDTMRHTYGQYYKREKKFIDGISENLRKKLLIRNYPNKAMSIINRLIASNYPDVCVSIDDTYINKNLESSFAEIVMSAKLCVLDHIETPWLEVLYIKKPFIVFFDENFTENYFDMETEQKYVDMMKRVGLLQDSPEAAAKLVNEIYQDVDSWWNESERQAVLGELRRRYVEEYTDVEEYWIKEVQNLLKQ